jgi:predicted lipid-binding transport protein (Tim44 family)
LPNDAFDPSLLILAALAAIVVWKLRSVLGIRPERDISPRTGFEPKGAAPGAPFRPRPLPGGPGPSSGPAPTPAERWTGLAEKGSAAWAGLDSVAAADPSFDGQGFIQGARKAYEMIVAAFAKGDRATLQRLLTPDVFEHFAADIAGRETRGETVDTHLVSLDRVAVDDASAKPGANSVTVRFASKLITTRRGRDGAILDGGPDRTVSVTDIWTFTRDPAAQDPNWKLSATSSV